ncbi:Transducin beta-like protein 2 [Homalodisca vitripennis]|nr:Transducin beta-like protein 2 [Homalodisca vitripennis]
MLFLDCQVPRHIGCRPQHYVPTIMAPPGSAGVYPMGYPHIVYHGQQPLPYCPRPPTALVHPGQYGAPHINIGEPHIYYGVPIVSPGTGFIQAPVPVISHLTGPIRPMPPSPMTPLLGVPRTPLPPSHLTPLLAVPGKAQPAVPGGPLHVLGESRTLRSDGSSTESSSDEEGPIRADGGSPGTSVRGGNSCELHNCLKSYLLKPSELLELGYPVESELFPGKAMILRTSDPSQPRSQGFNVDVKEFVPMGSDSTMSLNRPYPIPKHTSDRNSCHTPPKTGAVERKCVRCKKYFLVTDNGEYVSSEQCIYHWGRLYPNPSCPSYYLCCEGIPSSQGCSTCRRHVWSGISTGMNGPLEGFVRTLPRQNPTPEDRPDVYALDCEMGFTVRGLELLKVTVITQDGSVKYESLVRPEAEIVDYNTRFSGVKEEDYRGNFKTLREVQSDLTEFIKEDTILIGHGLENDLRALRMVHSSCVDTAVVFPHRRGLPFRRALRDLVMYVLGRSIQGNPEGHDSTEDARACLDLLRYKIFNDFKISF